MKQSRDQSLRKLFNYGREADKPRRRSTPNGKVPKANRDGASCRAVIYKVFQSVTNTLLPLRGKWLTNPSRAVSVTVLVFRHQQKFGNDMLSSADELSERDALVRIIRVQQQMILDVLLLKRNLDASIRVLSGLDKEFERLYFANIISYDPSELPGTIPSREELCEALRNLGWHHTSHDGLEFWNSLSDTQPDPFDGRPGLLK